MKRWHDQIEENMFRLTSIAQLSSKEDHLKSHPAIIYFGENKRPTDAIPAYLSSELGEILPDRIKGKYWLTCEKVGLWEVGYVFEGEILNTFEGRTEANARAKMLIYLKENNLI